jgi:glycosyltransferase involved in cell wall biosynthesis
MRKHRFRPVYIENNLKRWPKLTKPYIQLQYANAMRRIAGTELAFFFSTDITMGMTSRCADLLPQPKRMYVGFTQDDRWSAQKIARMSVALNRCDAVTTFSEAERALYINRYNLDPRRIHFIHIHTDETGEYRQYPEVRPVEPPYVLSLGSPNRRFMPIARVCSQLRIPLVIITRPWHKNDSLDELRGLGATIITDADKSKSLTYLKHAKFCAMCFETDELPGAFTTLVHSMFLRTPTVVTNCLGMSDYVIHGETGLIASHGNEQELGEAIEHLWRSEGMPERFAAKAHERAMSLHSLQAAAERFEQLAMHVLQTD